MSEYSGGKRGLVLSLRPKRYKTTEQQKAVRAAAECCGITKGIKRKELINKMRMCVPRFYELKKEGYSQEQIKEIIKKES